MSRISCENVDRALWRYVDREISASELSEITAHLKDCTGCRALYHDRATEVSQYRKAFAPSPFGEGFVTRFSKRLAEERVLAELGRDRVARISPSRRNLFVMAAAAVVFVPLAIVAGVLLTRPRALGSFEAEGGLVSKGRLAPQGELTFQEADTRQGAIYAGTGFQVPEGTRVSFSLEFPWSRRETRLVLEGPGTIYFEEDATRERLDLFLHRGLLAAKVATLGAGEALLLETPQARVSVLGTEFEVEVTEKQTILKSVTEGKVALEAISGKREYVTPTPENPVVWVVEEGALAPICHSAPDAQAAAGVGPAPSGAASSGPATSVTAPSAPPPPPAGPAASGSSSAPGLPVPAAGPPKGPAADLDNPVNGVPADSEED
jgi:hypothetical protein